MQIHEMDDLNMRESYELQNIAKNLSKLEYLAFQQKLMKNFIDNFLLKIPNLKYFHLKVHLLDLILTPFLIMIMVCLIFLLKIYLLQLKNENSRFKAELFHLRVGSN